MAVANTAARASLLLFSSTSRTGQPHFSQLSACRWQSLLHRGHGIQSIPSLNLPQAKHGGVRHPALVSAAYTAPS